MNGWPRAGAMAVMSSPSPEQAASGERHGVIVPISVHIEKSPEPKRAGCRDARRLSRRCS